MPYKALFFDLGNVLLYFSHDKMYRQIADLFGLEREKIATPDFVELMIEKYETGQIDTQAVHHFLCTQSGKRVDCKHTVEAISNIFELNHALVPVIKELKEKKIPLFVLSNTCEAHFNYAYTHYPILHLFDGYILSYEVGTKKPESKIFEKALITAGCKPHEAFYTDDISEFVQSAKRLNIDAEQFLDVPTLKSHLLTRGLLSPVAQADH